MNSLAENNGTRGMEPVQLAGMPKTREVRHAGAALMAPYDKTSNRFVSNIVWSFNPPGFRTVPASAGFDDYSRSPQQGECLLRLKIAAHPPMCSATTITMRRSALDIGGCNPANLSECAAWITGVEVRVTLMEGLPLPVSHGLQPSLSAVNLPHSLVNSSAQAAMGVDPCPIMNAGPNGSPNGSNYQQSCRAVRFYMTRIWPCAHKFPV